MLGSANLGVFRGTPYTMRELSLPGGDAGIYKTIAEMEKLVEGPEGVRSPEVRAAALEAVRGSVKSITEIPALLDWVKTNIEFRGENDETLQSPRVTLKWGAGDCDDHATLIAALAKSLGYEVRFETVAVAREAPTEFSHVYAEIRDKISGAWVPVDSTVAESFAGWQPSDITRQQMYKLSGLRGRLGDDSGSYTVEDVNSLVPIPSAASTASLTPNQAILYNTIEPFAQAGASLLAHGPTPYYPPTYFGSPGGVLSGSGWILIVGAVALVAFLAMRR